MNTNDTKTAQEFLTFMLEYYSLVRRHIVESNQYRLHSHSFSLMYTLRENEGRKLTMTDYSREIGVTKQQLTKLVNDLEDKGYVRRIHNTENRRQVYVEISEEGKAYLDSMLSEVTTEITSSLSYLDEAEKEKLSKYSSELAVIFKKDREGSSK